MRHGRILIPIFLLTLLTLASAALAQQPATPPLQQRYNEAVQKFEAGDYQGAAALLEPLKSQPRLPPHFFALLGASYIELGRIEEAQAMLDPIAGSDTAGPALLFNAARAAFALKQEEKGEAYLKRAVARGPKTLAARALGLRYGRQGRVQEALELLRPWIEAHPDDQEARLGAAFCAVELNRAEEAGALLAPLPEDLPQARLLRARLLLDTDPRQAIASLAPLEAAPPPGIERDLRWILADARLRTGDAAGAAAGLAGKTGEDPVLALLLAQALQQTGDPAQVLATLKPFVDRLPDPANAGAQRGVFAAVALEYGRALIAGAKWAEAVAVLEKSTALDGSIAVAWQLYGQALNGAGRREDARKALAKFQELSTP